MAGVAGRGEVQSGIMELLCRRGEAGTEPPMPVNSQVQQPWTFTYLFKRFPVAVAGDAVAERTFLAVTDRSIQGMLIFSMHRIALIFPLAGAHE